MKAKLNDDVILDFGATDPRQWRDLPDPEEANEEAIENDVEVPASQYVIDTLGFDPKDL